MTSKRERAIGVDDIRVRPDISWQQGGTRHHTTAAGTPADDETDALTYEL